jgi:hypothetical protein
MGTRLGCIHELGGLVKAFARLEVLIFAVMRTMYLHNVLHNAWLHGLDKAFKPFG